jgi:hypothetical protein
MLVEYCSAGQRGRATGRVGVGQSVIGRDRKHQRALSARATYCHYDFEFGRPTPSRLRDVGSPSDLTGD